MNKKLVIVGWVGLFIVGCVLLYRFSQEYRAVCREVPATLKKRIVILYSKGGGGHSSAMVALAGYLAPRYDVIPVNVWDDIFHSMDIIRKLSLGYWGGEEVYNSFAALQMTSFLHFCADYGLFSTKRYRRTYVRLAQEFFSCYKPDLIISVTPVFNGVVACAAQKLSIPFLIFPPDFDLGLYLNNIDAACAQSVYCAVSYDDPLVYATAPTFDRAHMVPVGFPLRDGFFTQKDPAQIRAHFSFPEQKPCVMVLMGSAGSVKVLQYLKRLAQVQVPVHLVICIGRNEKLRTRISRIFFPKHISYSVIGFTKEIADLMAVCDIMITKPGATSVAEALQMQLPLLLDDTSQTLRWERTALEFVQAHKLGKVVHSFSEVSSLLEAMLADKPFLDQVRSAMKRFDSEQYPEKLILLIRKLLEGVTINF